VYSTAYFDPRVEDESFLLETEASSFAENQRYRALADRDALTSRSSDVFSSDSVVAEMLALSRSSCRRSG
jgi:hypothetical protein